MPHKLFMFTFSSWISNIVVSVVRHLDCFDFLFKVAVCFVFGFLLFWIPARLDKKNLWFALKIENDFNIPLKSLTNENAKTSCQNYNNWIILLMKISKLESKSPVNFFMCLFLNFFVISFTGIILSAVRIPFWNKYRRQYNALLAIQNY